MLPLELKRALRVYPGSAPASQQLTSLLGKVAPAESGAGITIGDETANVRALTVDLKDALGEDSGRETVVKVMLLDSADPATGLATLTTGALSLTAGTMVQDISATVKDILTSGGSIGLDWTDAGTDAVYLGILLPTGEIIVSELIQNAP